MDRPFKIGEFFPPETVYFPDFESWLALFQIICFLIDRRPLLFSSARSMHPTDMLALRVSFGLQLYDLQVSSWLPPVLSTCGCFEGFDPQDMPPLNGLPCFQLMLSAGVVDEGSVG